MREPKSISEFRGYRGHLGREVVFEIFEGVELSCVMPLEAGPHGWRAISNESYEAALFVNGKCVSMDVLEDQSIAQLGKVITFLERVGRENVEGAWFSLEGIRE